MSGPPETVAVMMAALGSAGEIVFDARSSPDPRGDVTCTARVAHASVSGPMADPDRADIVVQAAFTADAASWPDLAGQGAADLEAAVSSALSSLPGTHRASSRIVAVTASRTAGK
ncbi:hypothetical protein [Streptomyces chartreusis]|uniref:hypothetical protein n=1 Tax=Streptomyces chartreusis TaxID=1969 RepID=UPI00386B5FC3|nr:hypothetical protein OG938_44380 [Streptomyces chartreusis]